MIDVKMCEEVCILTGDNGSCLGFVHPGATKCKCADWWPHGRVPVWHFTDSPGVIKSEPDAGMTKAWLYRIPTDCWMTQARYDNLYRPMTRRPDEERRVLLSRMATEYYRSAKFGGDIDHRLAAKWGGPVFSNESTYINPDIVKAEHFDAASAAKDIDAYAARAGIAREAIESTKWVWADEDGGKRK